MPESLQESDWGLESQEAQANHQNAIDSLEEAVALLEDDEDDMDEDELEEYIDNAQSSLSLIY